MPEEESRDTPAPDDSVLAQLWEGTRRSFNELEKSVVDLRKFYLTALVAIWAASPALLRDQPFSLKSPPWSAFLHGLAVIILAYTLGFMAMDYRYQRHLWKASETACRLEERLRLEPGLGLATELRSPPRGPRLLRRLRHWTRASNAHRNGPSFGLAAFLIYAIPYLGCASFLVGSFVVPADWVAREVPLAEGGYLASGLIAMGVFILITLWSVLQVRQGEGGNLMVSREEEGRIWSRVMRANQDFVEKAPPGFKAIKVKTLWSHQLATPGANNVVVVSGDAIRMMDSVLQEAFSQKAITGIIAHEVAHDFLLTQPPGFQGSAEEKETQVDRIACGWGFREEVCAFFREYNEAREGLMWPEIRHPPPECRCEGFSPQRRR